MGIAAAVIGSAVIGGAVSMAAANKQAGAAKDAANLTAGQYNTTRGDLSPYRESGGMALNELNFLLGLGPSSGPGGPGGGAMPTQSQFMMPGQAGPGGPVSGNAFYNSFTGGAATPLSLARPNPTDYGGYQAQAQTGRPQVPDTAAYQAALAQWQAQQGKPPGAGYGSLLQPFSLDKFQQSPDYQFNLQQGQMAIDKSANARGNFYAPQTLQDISKYSQGLASQEFQQAYNMYNTDQSNIYNRLFNQVGVGQGAANQTGAFGANAANTQSQLITGGGAAQAAGMMGAGQSLSQLAYLPQILQQNQASSFSPAPAQYGYSGSTGLSTMY